MLARLRWFIYGSITTIGATTYIVVKIRRMRETMTPQTVVRATVLSMADAMAFTGRRLAGKQNRRLQDQHPRPS